MFLWRSLKPGHILAALAVLSKNSEAESEMLANKMKAALQPTTKPSSAASTTVEPA